MKSTLDQWIVCPKPRPNAAMHLFCFPYAGGGASIFRTWTNDLPPWVEVCAIQFPGRENRLQEPSFVRLIPLVQVLAQIIQAHGETPFAFFGHSFGGLVSFE